MIRLPDAGSPRVIENRTFDEVAIGDGASLSRRLTQGDIDLLAVASGEEITATVSVLEERSTSMEIVLDCLCVNGDGVVVISGRTRVRAPTEKVIAPRLESPDTRFTRHERFRALISEARSQAPLPTAIAHPRDADSLGPVVERTRMASRARAVRIARWRAAAATSAVGV